MAEPAVISLGGDALRRALQPPTLESSLGQLLGTGLSTGIQRLTAPNLPSSVTRPTIETLLPRNISSSAFNITGGIPAEGGFNLGIQRTAGVAPRVDFASTLAQLRDVASQIGDVNVTQGIDDLLARIRGVPTGQAASPAILVPALQQLRSQVAPGFGRLSQAAADIIGAERTRRTSDLRAQLSRRRISGPLASIAEAPVLNELAILENQLASQAIVQEIQTSAGLVGQEAELLQQEVQNELNQAAQAERLLGLEAGVLQQNVTNKLNQQLARVTAISQEREAVQAQINAELQELGASTNLASSILNAFAAATELDKRLAFAGEQARGEFFGSQVGSPLDDLAGSFLSGAGGAAASKLLGTTGTIGPTAAAGVPAVVASGLEPVFSGPSAGASAFIPGAELGFTGPAEISSSPNVVSTNVSPTSTLRGIGGDFLTAGRSVLSGGATAALPGGAFPADTSLGTALGTVAVPVAAIAAIPKIADTVKGIFDDNTNAAQKQAATKVAELLSTGQNLSRAAFLLGLSGGGSGAGDASAIEVKRLLDKSGITLPPTMQAILDRAVEQQRISGRAGSTIDSTKLGFLDPEEARRQGVA